MLGLLLLDKQLKIPRMLLKLKTLRGKKLRGVRTMPAMTLNVVTLMEGIKVFSESAKRIIKATQAARSSMLKSSEIHIRALRP